MAMFNSFWLVHQRLLDRGKTSVEHWHVDPGFTYATQRKPSSARHLYIWFGNDSCFWKGSKTIIFTVQLELPTCAMGCRKTVDDRGLKNPILMSFLPSVQWKSMEVNHFITACCFLTCCFLFFHSLVFIFRRFLFIKPWVIGAMLTSLDLCGHGRWPGTRLAIEAEATRRMDKKSRRHSDHFFFRIQPSICGS